MHICCIPTYWSDGKAAQRLLYMYGFISLSNLRKDYQLHIRSLFTTDIETCIHAHDQKRLVH